MNFHHCHKHFDIVPMINGDTISIAKVGIDTLENHISAAYFNELKELMKVGAFQDTDILYLVEFNTNLHIFKALDIVHPQPNGFGYFAHDVLGKQVDFSLVQREMVLCFHSERRCPSHLYKIDENGDKKLDLEKAQQYFSQLHHQGYLPNDILCWTIDDIYGEINEGIFNTENYVVPLIN